MKFILNLLFASSLLTISSNLIAEQFLSQQKKNTNICLTEQEFQEITKALEDLLSANEKLLKIAKEYEQLLSSTPLITISPLLLIIDDKSRTFLQEKVPGKLSFGNLNYDLDLKVQGTIAKKIPPPYGFNLKFKATYLYSFEINKDGNLRGFHSGGLGIEPFYYKNFNANLIIGSRFIAPAIGYDITEHFGILLGVGLNWTRNSALFVGTSFDF